MLEIFASNDYENINYFIKSFQSKLLQQQQQINN